MAEITANMTITDVVAKYPKTVDVFQQYGMHCFGWMAARYENIEQGARAHGIDVPALINDLNKVVH